MVRLPCALLFISWVAAATPLLPPLEAPVARAAATGTVRGRVDIQREQGAAERRPQVSELGMPGRRDLPDQRVAVVYLETAPRGAFEDRPGPTVVLDQRNENFVPHILAITTGTTVEFLNSDRTYHNVFSLSKANRFDLGRYPPGRAKAVRFDHPGIVRVFCEIHSHMNAFILVFAHRHFAVTNAQGEYRIDGVPPGTYTVSVWHPAFTVKSESVKIPEQGGEVDASFVLS
jgi:plastocyanin